MLAYTGSAEAHHVHSAGARPSNKDHLSIFAVNSLILPAYSVHLSLLFIHIKCLVACSLLAGSAYSLFFLQPSDSHNDGHNTNALQREGGSRCYQKSRLAVCYLLAVVKPGPPLGIDWTDHVVIATRVLFSSHSCGVKRSFSGISAAGQPIFVIRLEVGSGTWQLQRAERLIEAE